ncbi:MAG: bifunctional 4-hydroxy-2-oxoglutarate aldolase/2-dehydro-3-deoxy-phosphogluconate aldolase [Sciscionella sp.]
MSTVLPRSEPSSQLLDTGAIAILRASTDRHVLPAAMALAEAGIACLEITLTVPGAVRTLRALVDELAPQVAVGAGTVTTAAEAEEAVAAGASFLVSPALCPEVVACARERALGCYPGAWTPTEVLAAWRSGATAVKLFPAATGGAAYLRRLRDPLPDIPIVPTGGIGIEQVGDYLRAGALAVGMGAPLLGDALDGGDLGGLRARARRVLDAVAAARSVG